MDTKTVNTDEKRNISMELDLLSLAGRYGSPRFIPPRMQFDPETLMMCVTAFYTIAHILIKR
jgi:hypothetical protein